MSHQVSTALTSGENNVLMLLISALLILALFRAYSKLEVAFLSRQASLSGRLVNLIGLGSYLSYFEYATPSHSKAIIHTRKSLPPSLLSISFVPLEIKKISYLKLKNLEFKINFFCTGYLLLLNNFQINKFKLYFDKELFNFFNSQSNPSIQSSTTVNQLLYDLFQLNKKKDKNTYSAPTQSSSFFLTTNEISSSYLSYYYQKNSFSSSDPEEVIVNFDLSVFQSNQTSLHNIEENYSLIFIPTIDSSNYLPKIYDPSSSSSSSSSKKFDNNGDSYRSNAPLTSEQQIISTQSNLLSKIKPNLSILPYPFSKTNSNPSFNYNNQATPHDLEQGLNMTGNNDNIEVESRSSSEEENNEKSNEEKKREEDNLCQLENLSSQFASCIIYNFSFGNIFVTSPSSSVPSTPNPAPAPSAAPSSTPAETSASSNNNNNNNNYKLIPKDIYIIDKLGHILLSSEIFGLEATGKPATPPTAIPKAAKSDFPQPAPPVASTAAVAPVATIAPISLPTSLPTQAENEYIPHGGKFIEEDCVICLTDPKNILLLPCRHLCVCSNCLIYVDKCPVCRAQFEEYVTIKDKIKYKVKNSSGLV